MGKMHIAAIHDGILSRYITGVSGTQKSAYAGYFFRPAEAVRRYPFQELLHKDVIGQIGILCALTEEILIIRSEEHTSELQSLMRISYAVFCSKNKQAIRHTDGGITPNVLLVYRRKHAERGHNAGHQVRRY